MWLVITRPAADAGLDSCMHSNDPIDSIETHPVAQAGRQKAGTKQPLPTTQDLTLLWSMCEE